MLIDRNPVAPLRYVRNDAGFVEISAMTRWRDLEDSAEIAQISRLIPPPPDAFTGLIRLPTA
jgi:CO/xanthine dehydrogenase FAD-binding subunit